MTDKRSAEYAIEQLRPQFNIDGGDIKLIDVKEEEDEIIISLSGACGSCGVVEQHLGAVFEQQLKVLLPELKTVTIVDEET